MISHYKAIISQDGNSKIILTIYSLSLFHSSSCIINLKENHICYSYVTINNNDSFDDYKYSTQRLLKSAFMHHVDHGFLSDFIITSMCLFYQFFDAHYRHAYHQQ